jgi:hypothetical protein
MRNIKISLETAQRWHNGQDQELKDLAVQTYPELAKKELPKSWEELGQEHNLYHTIEQLDASFAMRQLSQLLTVYNDGWVPDWSDYDTKYVILFFEDNIATDWSYAYKRFLAFKTRELRDEFLTNFRSLILTAKPLL